MNFLSLFSGIGGFDLGLERAGMQCVGQVEIDKFCNKVLEKHWPHVKRMGDIKDVKGDEFGTVDLICGGFPCQPFSCAGKRKGKDDNRYLWPEMLRVIKAVKPAWIIGENVAGIVGMALDTVCTDLENEGYAVQTFIIPASGVNAPHRRYRCWIIANGRFEQKRNEKSGFGCREQSGNATEQQTDKGNGFTNKSSSAPNSLCNGHKERYKETGGAEREGKQGGVRESKGENRIYSHSHSIQGFGEQQNCKKSHRLRNRENAEWNKNWIEVATEFCRMDDGIPNRVDRLKSLGNAVVPQIVEIIGRYIMEANNGTANL